MYAEIFLHNNSTKNTNSHPNPNPTTKQHAIVNIYLNIVTRPTYPDKFMRDLLLHSVQLEVVIVTVPTVASMQFVSGLRRSFYDAFFVFSTLRVSLTADIIIIIIIIVQRVEYEQTNNTVHRK